MKRLCDDETNNGLEQLIGETVLLMCANYFYHGRIKALSDTDVELSEASIVYDTGPWDEEGFSDQQTLPGNVFVRLQAVESYVQK